MTGQDINQLARDQAVLEERVESRHKEHASSFDRLITLFEASDAKREAMDAKMTAHMQASDAKFDTLEAKQDARVAKMTNQVILWLVGWITALFLLGLAVLYEFPPIVVTVSAPPPATEQAAPASAAALPAPATPEAPTLTNR